MPPKIRILPPEIVNRIAAGEVVERPASVLKELVENSIDASATQVFVDLEEGGTKRILVRDNGSGLGPEDMQLAFESHATSKLTEADLETNLLGVSTLGFRGEALASIASVSMVEMVSRTHGAPHASRFRPSRDKPGGELEPAAAEMGTTIEVRNLFYNVPARRKFLRSPGTELSHAVQQLTRIALGFPGLHFKLTSARKPLLDLPAVNGLGDRLRQLLEKGIAEKLLEVRHEPDSRGGPGLVGFVGPAKVHRKDARGQHLFVNGRWVRDRVLSHALRSAYQGFQIPGYQPIAYLFLDLPPGEVDVNVHPTKSEVRFRDSSEVYRLVHHSVREALERSRESQPATQEVPVPAGGMSAEPGCQGGVSARDDRDPRARIEQAALDFFAAPPRPERDYRNFAAASPTRRPAVLDPSTPRSDLGEAAPIERPVPPDRPALKVYQILESYLLIEREDGILLIDQHALHEKILFEEIYRRISGGEVERQRLLIPEVLDLSADLMVLVDEAAEVLRPFGFELERFGPATAAVHAFPAILDRGPGQPQVASIVRSVLEALRSEIGGVRSQKPVEDQIYRIAATIACKRAVKAGMPLSASEIEHLLARGDLAEDPRHCPHGRPTSIAYSRRDIERGFDRK